MNKLDEFTVATIAHPLAPINALVCEMSAGNLLALPPLARGVMVLCRDALTYYEETGCAPSEEAEFHYAAAIAMAVWVLTLIGAGRYLLAPEGCQSSPACTPDAKDALLAAYMLSSLAGERWPAPPPSWYEDPGDDADGAT